LTSNSIVILPERFPSRTIIGKDASLLPEYTLRDLISIPCGKRQESENKKTAAIKGIFFKVESLLKN
jgi:hypothetical protein